MGEKSCRKISTEERRKRFRVKSSLVVVRCSSKYLFETNLLSRDISEDGICVLIPYRMEIGEVAELGIYLPGHKEPVIAIGEVVRRNETNDVKFPFLAGIKFINIDKGMCQQIFKDLRYYILKEQLD